MKKIVTFCTLVLIMPIMAQNNRAAFKPGEWLEVPDTLWVFERKLCNSTAKQ